MDPERQQKLPVKHNRPGEKFVRSFKKRHHKPIAFARALRQEGIRFNAINAETLTAHIAAVEQLIKNHNIDPCRLANLDETGATADKEALGITSFRTFSPRESMHEVRIPTFKNVSRVTIMPVIFASGVTRRPLFIFKGTRILHGVIESNEGLLKQSVADCLPPNALVTTREELADVDKSNFARWAEMFVQNISHLTRQGRKVLLLYDGYRSHMSLKALTILRNGNVVAYCLPSHTSGKTQPLDLTVFAPFKHNIAACIKQISLVQQTEPYDVFDFCNILRHAYENSFTPANITAGFERAGLWPINLAKLLYSPKPDGRCKGKMLSVDEMLHLLEQKRIACRNYIGIQPVVWKRGFLDTSKGLTLTSDAAMRMFEGEEREKRVKFEDTQRKKAEANAKRAFEAAMQKQARHDPELANACRRASLYGEPFVVPRPLRIRRALAAKKAADRRDAASALASLRCN